MILKMHQVTENRLLRVAHEVATGDRLLQYDPSQVHAFDVIPHVGNATKAAHPLLVALRFVANAEGALGLGTDEGEWLRIWCFLLHERVRRKSDP